MTVRIKHMVFLLIAAHFVSSCSSAADRAGNSASSSVDGNAQSPAEARTYAKDSSVAGQRHGSDYRPKTELQVKLLDEIDSRYFKKISNNPIGANTNLERLGFPSESDWISAQNKTDEELLAEARSGTPVAKQLYIDRVISKIPVVGWRGVGSSAEDSRLGIQMLEARAMTMQNITDTGSVFSIYQAGAFYDSTSVGGNLPMVAASFQIAGELGDSRAQQMLNSFFLLHPKVEAQGVLAGYSILKGYLPK